MKASELMLGDWVNWHTYTNRPNYCKIKQISFDTRIEGSDDFNCEPIPLTEEILKANGWVVRLNDGEYCSPIDISYKEPLRLQVGEDGNAFWWIVGIIIIVPINHVHELQHALRLCGLTDLANNFKIL